MHETDVNDGGCEVEALSLPHITSSSNYLRHEISMQSVQFLLKEFSVSLATMPLAIKHLAHHADITAGGILHTLSPHACMSQVTALNHFNQSTLPENVYTVLNVVINSNLVVYDKDSPVEDLLRPIIGGERQKQEALQEETKITCMYQSPDLLVGQSQCQSMIEAESKMRGLVNNAKDLSTLTRFPSFLVRNNEQLKPFAFGDELLCSDLQLKMSLEKLFYEYDSFHLRIKQACEFFNITCGFVSCGMDLANKDLIEMDKFAKCLLSSTKNFVDKMSGGRHKRELHIFSSLLESLGLVKSSSQISLEHFNQVSKHNFDQLKNNQLGLEQALLDQSKDLHRVLKKENDQLESVYDRVSMLSSHMHLLNRVGHAREQILTSHDAFGAAFQKLTLNLELLLEMSLSPLTQTNNGVYCRHSECVDSRSLIVKKKEDKLIVAARLVKVESVEAGRVSCPLMKLGDDILVHGMLDKVVYQKDNIFYSQEGNKEVTPSCLKTGLNCPEGMRVVNPGDLLLNSLYMFLQGDSVKIQCIKDLQLVNKKGNFTCNLNPIQVEAPFVITGPNVNYLVDNHNVHVYISLPRKVAVFEQDAFHRKKMPTVPGYSGAHLLNDFKSNNFEPLKNLVHGVIVFTPISALFLVCLCTCFCVKCPALRTTVWSAVTKCWEWCGKCCGATTGQCSPPRVEAPLGAECAPEEELVCAPPPPIPPLRESRPFLSQPEPGYGRSFRSRGAEGAGVSFSNTGGPGVSLPQHLRQQDIQNPDLMATRNISNSLKRLNDKILASGESLARLAKKIEK